MKVLHFIPVYKPAWQYGGPVRSVSKLSEGLAAQGHEVTVITTNANGNASLPVVTEGSTCVDGVQTYYCVRDPFFPYIESFQLRRVVASLIACADIVHISSMWQPLGFSVSKAALNAKKPYIYSLRGGINEWTWAQRKLRHKLYWRVFEYQQLVNASALHATCEAERDDVRAIGVGRDQNFVVVPNSVDVAEYARNPDLGSKFRKLLGITGQERLMLFLGRLHPKKGIDLSLMAAAQVLRESPDWLYVIAGPSDRHYERALLELMQELGLAAQVRIVDLVDGDVRLGALSAADLFILTSYNENFGMSVIEAMSASTPVIISDKVGISREIAQDSAGYVVPLDIAAIQCALKKLFVDSDMRRHYSEKGRNCVLKRFDSPIVAKQMASEYSNLLLQLSGT